MEKQLPKNWVETELGNYAMLKNGYAFKSNDFQAEGLPVVKISNIKDFKIEIENSICVDESKLKTDFIIAKGDILIAMSGATTGKYGVFEQDVIALQNQRVGNLKPVVESFSNRRFLLYLLGSLKEEIEEKAYGAAQPNISPKLIESINICLPPLTEQNRIVTKLDTLFNQLETIKASMAKIPVLLKEFRQQVLTQAVTGKLTEEWRKGKELENEFSNRIVNKEKRQSKIILPKEWLDLSFDAVVQIKSNLVNPNDYLDFPLITPDVIQSETGLLLSKPLVSDIMPISAKHYFSKGDIVYSKIRPYLSKLILVDFDGLCSADMYPISTDLNIKYLFYFMLSNEFLVFATTAGERSVLPKINQKGLNIIPIPTPSLDEQQEIVSRVESLFAKADAIEQQYLSVKEKIDTLPQALLHKAFKGELTEQLESDGDARELLKEIQELKIEQSNKKKVKKK